MHIKCPGRWRPQPSRHQKTEHMKNNRIIDIATWAIVLISALGTLSVSLMALVDPQGVMAMVHTPLDNTDAYSSVRGVFGGVGLTLAAIMVWVFRRDRTAGLGFIALFWGNYALCRALTIAMDGPLGAFGGQWIVIETMLALAALALYVVRKRAVKVHQDLVWS
jgi:hypothetical protein